MAEPKELPSIPGYRLLRPIGVGGMGSVFEAEKLSTHETFAVKLIRENLVADESYIVRFEREVKALRSIRHPNVVDVFEWSLGDSAGSRPYVVMELLEGESLNQYLRRSGVLEPAVAVQIMLQVVEGLAAAHGAGVLHRDLGPSNIFLERRSSGKLSVRLLDFGLARAMFGGDAGRAVTQEGMLLGKPAYVAPELLCGRPVGEGVDVFACGINMFRMLTGRLPFKSTDAQMLWVERWAERETAEELPSPRTFVPTLPEPLAEVVNRAVRKRPEDRYASARAMQVALLDAEPMPVRDQASVRSGAPAPVADAHSSTILGRSTVSGAPVAPPRRPAARIAAALFAAVAVVVALKLIVPGGESGTAAPPKPAAAPPATVGAPAPVDPVPHPAPVARSAESAQAPTAPAPGPATPAVEPAVPPRPGETVAAATEAPAPATEEVPSTLRPPASREDPPRPARTVHFAFDSLPAGAQVTVAGRRVDPRAGADVPWSLTPVAVAVEVPGGRYERWTGFEAATADRTIAPTLRDRAPAAAATQPPPPDPVHGPAPPTTEPTSADAGDPRATGRLGTSIVTEWGTGQ